MSSSVIAPGSDQGAPKGHCSRCGKVWTLNERQGVCQWCKRLAVCQSSQAKPRRDKFTRKPKPEQEHNGNGYDQLPDPYLTYYNVALPFAKSVPTQDSQDLLHTIIANLADAGRNNGHKPDNPSWMYRIASFTKAQYWRDRYRLTNGLTCCNCSKTQRRKCKENWLYSQCPKAIKIESLHKPIIDSEGNLTELGDLIADDRALDLDAWLDDKTFILTSPERLLLIGEKIRDGIALTQVEHNYLCRFRKREQKKLF